MSNRKKTTTRGRPSKFPPEFRRTGTWTDVIEPSTSPPD